MSNNNVKNIQVRLNIDKEEGKQIYKHLQTKSSMNLYIQDLILRDISGEEKENDVNTIESSDLVKKINGEMNVFYRELSKRFTKLEDSIMDALPVSDDVKFKLIDMNIKYTKSMIENDEAITRLDAKRIKDVEEIKSLLTKHINKIDARVDKALEVGAKRKMKSFWFFLKNRMGGK